MEMLIAGALLILGVLLLVVLIKLMALTATARNTDAQLAQTSARLEILSAEAARTTGSLQIMSGAQESRIQSLAQSTSGALEAMRTALDQRLGQAQTEAREGRAELAQHFQDFEQRQRESLESLKTDLNGQLAVLTSALREHLESHGQQIKHQLSFIQESIAQQLGAMAQANQQQAEQVRAALNERLQAMQTDNAQKLDEMRKTVDEKLHATLEQRLGQSFQMVSERLEQVHRGLGEMQTLAAGVGDLKRVLTNVKTRGIWGEVQLEAMIEQIFTPEQYGRNVATRPGSAERVEIAIRLPGGRDDGQPVWLPIDAKFPVEDYQRLLDAHDRADVEQIEAAAKALEVRIRAEAKTIREKYLEPPFTTDFAVMYLPTEGLYAEVLRRPALAETIQREQRVLISGPTNLAAMLNSLQMGFRTLAIEKRASDVWQVLGQVKSEFGKFGEVIAATQKKLEQASRQFDQVGTRTRAIERRLREVEALPVLESGAMELLDADEDSPQS
jgi:DNA recombination protein RmuC